MQTCHKIRYKQTFMKALWLTAGSGLLQTGHMTYNGGGWIASLQQAVMQQSDIQLALAYSAPVADQPKTVDNCTYYPVHVPRRNALRKLAYYYGGYKHVDNDAYVQQIREIAADFQPDVIHLFGMENVFSTVLGKLEQPIIVHLQGLLSPVENAFFPPGMNQHTVLWPFRMREWIWRNGILFAKKHMAVRSLQEKAQFKQVQYAMGRTEWDRHVSSLLSSNIKYFHVDEVMRPIFYQWAGRFSYPQNRKPIIVSTISETFYKGLDLILKTAHLLECETTLDFEWQVIGVSPDSDFGKIFSRNLHIHSKRVKYLGVLDAERLSQTLLGANLYVHPSYIDNSPNSLCEAQLLGMPVIGTYVGGVPSLIDHKQDGILVPANAPYELAYWIEHLLNNAEFSMQLGQKAAQKAALRHDKQTIVRQLTVAYQAVAHKEK